MVASASSFIDVPARSARPAKQNRSPIRSEDEISIKSLSIGFLLSSVALAACTIAWFVVLIAPIWGLTALLF